MKTFEYRDSNGDVISFEIPNIGRSRVQRFIKSTFPSATLERQHSEDFAKVNFNGNCFIVNEPWGDNSRYIIHQQPPKPSAELDELRRAFEQYRPSWFFSGDRSFTFLMLASAGVILFIALAIAWLS